MGALWFDFKLGLRMLTRYPVLTVVGGFAIAVAIGIGAAYFEFAHDVISSKLPLAEGDRVIGIQNWNAASAAPEDRSVHDFAAWRAQVRSIRDLGAFTTGQRNLLTDDGRVEPITIAEMTASGFRVARVPPFIGRPLLDSDEQPGAPPVVVMAHDVWEGRFGSDRGVVGRTAQIGAIRATVVGVMPKGFAFPLQNHLWMPLQVNVADVPRLQGPSIRVFGRLAPDVAMEQAQAELTAIGSRSAVEFPETNQHLRPRVVPYTQLFVPAEMKWQLYLLGSIFVMFLVVASVNVATLIFARTVTREGEIAVRNALGATRRRIVAQLFTEALVLSSLAAVVGLTAAAWGLERATRIFWEAQGPDSRPFWWEDSISSATLLAVALLTVVGAAIAGALPALKATERRVNTGLRDAGVRGSSLRFGGVWTAVIVTQVAITVAFLPTAISEAREAARYGTGGAGIPADRFLTARVVVDSETPPGAPTATDQEVDARLAAAYREIARRLTSESGVKAVTFADRLPGMEHPMRRIEMEGMSSETVAEGFEVREALVDVDFFRGSEVPVLSGRAFRAGDEGAPQVVIVNRSFVQQVLNGRNAVGQRVRTVATAGNAPGPWSEIAGVVDDLGMNPADPDEGAGIYRPVEPRVLSPFRLVVHLADGRPESLAPNLRRLAAEVEPSLRLYDVESLDNVAKGDQAGNRLVVIALGLVAFVTLLLSTVGIYSLISFTVSQRMREIGIRVALGANPWRILADIFSRVLIQLGLGVTAGGAVATLLLVAGLGDQMSREGPELLLMVSAIMLVVGIVACVMPAQRVLRVDPGLVLRNA